MTAIGKYFTSLVTTVLCIASTSVLFSGTVYGGNSEIIQNTIEELDKLNKEAVNKIPDLPADGTVDLKANVTMEEGKPSIRIIEKQINPKIRVNDSQSAPVKINSKQYRQDNVVLPNDTGEEKK